MGRPAKSDANRPAWAKRLEHARAITGMDGKSFARAIGFSNERGGERWMKYERGEREPSVEVWARVARETGVSLDFLIAGKARKES